MKDKITSPSVRLKYPISLILGAFNLSTLTPPTFSSSHGFSISLDGTITVGLYPCWKNSWERSCNCTDPEMLRGGNTLAINAIFFEVLVLNTTYDFDQTVRLI